MNAVYIYLDEGASIEGHHLLINHFKKIGIRALPINSQEIQQGRLQNARLLIMPGGRDIPYHQKLSGAGNRELKHFCQNGGSYLGICAGAYYGSAEIEFEKNCPLEVLGDRELGFFPGKAIGPAYGSNTFCYTSQKGAKAAHLSSSLFCYYNGGCYFAGAEEKNNTTILARYEDIMGKPAAIIECGFGKSKAILSGVHFEYSYLDLPPKNKYLKPIIPKLKQSEAARLKLFDQLLQRLL